MNPSSRVRVICGMVAMLAGAAAPAAEPLACQALTWTTLGTAGGPIPTADRSEPANLLNAGGRLVLVDTGDGTVNQLARLGHMIGAVRDVFISHHHLDHTGGLAAVIGLRWMNQFPGLITIHGPPGTREMVDGIVASMQPQARVGFGLGAADRPPADSVRVVELRGGDSVTVGDIQVTAAANSHFDHDGPQPVSPPQSLSFRFDFGGRSITYTGDTGPSDEVAKLARRTDLLVSEVMDLDRLYAELQQRRRDASPETLRDLRRHLATHHLTGDDVGRLAAKAGAGRVLLTHFAIPSGPLAESAAALSKGVAGHFGGPVALARDLSVHEVPCR
ncbi:MAG: MBL fold metallo-hydrolase [Proteobacteria bacterium]|jgi:ribonuclease BN (tRNA processing enzyme)|nr:MBL fold metallo-hydrolase [Pseudomonadota bacterium]MBK9250817.1 MBL fold metallo-hydrolase [Pseudomonadota bacterium]